MSNLADLFRAYPDLPVARPEEDVAPLTDRATLRAALTEMARPAPGLDPKGQAAFLVGRATYWQSILLLGCHLGAGGLPDNGGTPCATADGALRLTPPGPAIPATRETRRAALRERLVTHVTALAELLKEEVRFGPAAAWRMASDSLGSAALVVEPALACPEAARAEALTLMEGTPLAHAHRPTGFLEVARPDGGTEHFLSRAGCCRYYTAESGFVCHHCVLNSPEEQVALHRQTLRARVEEP